MQIAFRHYNGADDYQRVSDFLITHHQPGNRYGNWLEPMWEYMHFHPGLERSSLEKIGIWEQSGEVVAVAHYESVLGEAFFQFHPAYRHLREAMLDHAEANLTGISKKDGRKYLYAYVNDNASEFLALVQARGYEKPPKAHARTIATTSPTRFLPSRFPLVSA
jgi:hypothetical protein